MAISGILMAVVNIGMTTVLKEFVDIAIGDSAILLLQNFIAAVFFVALEGMLSLVTAVSYRVSCAKVARKIRLELIRHLYYSNLLEMQDHHVGEYMTNLTEDVEKVSGCLPTLVRSTVGNALTAVFAPTVRKASRQDKKNEEDIRVYFQDVLEKISLFKIGFMGKKLEDRAVKLLDAKIKSACRRHDCSSTII